jgi:integrase/recombinase XerD
MTPIAPHIEAFLRDHLPHHRGASPHTCDSYAYSFQLLFEFAAKKLKVAPSMVSLEQLDAALISAFLEHLEAARHSSSKHSIGRDSVVLPLFRASPASCTRTDSPRPGNPL